ncbi:MAG: HD domain-containing protein, partial [Acidobacteriota bacterium]|nr:HD domain-containing protein [Acidobacteriota bacterium]
MRLKTQGFLSTGLVTSAVLLLSLLLLQRLTTALGDPQFATQVSWHLLIIGLAAAILSSLAAWVVVRRITLPLRRLAEMMSAMARTGELHHDFASAGGGAEVRLIEETFRSLAVSLDESQRARELSYIEALGAVVAAADARDQETTGHSFRVARYAVALARGMGLPAGQLRAIEWGALLHDVGKMVVPDDILRKAGPLTPEEWHIMKQHPSWGYEMLGGVGFLQAECLEIVYSHHERWDGTGYPRRLERETIPVAARIFAVVDTYDAITSDRPYRRAKPHTLAVAEIRRVAGQQLDPAVVVVFLYLLEVE